MHLFPWSLIDWLFRGKKNKIRPCWRKYVVAGGGSWVYEDPQHLRSLSQLCSWSSRCNLSASCSFHHAFILPSLTLTQRNDNKLFLPQVGWIMVTLSLQLKRNWYRSIRLFERSLVFFILLSISCSPMPSDPPPLFNPS